MIETIFSKQPNFGVDDSLLKCFNSMPSRTYDINHQARDFAIKGIDLFEIPSANLGTPLKMLHALGNPANVFAYYIGLGRLMETKKIGYMGKEIESQELLSYDPVRIVSCLVQSGYYCNAICRMKAKFKNPAHILQGNMPLLFESKKKIKEQFLHSLIESEQTRLYKDERPHFSKDPKVNEITHLKNDIFELYAQKIGKEFLWDIGDGKTMRRAKTRSVSEGREGWLYFTTEVNNGKSLVYSCTCPARVECKHVKAMKETSQ